MKSTMCNVLVLSYLVGFCFVGPAVLIGCSTENTCAPFISISAKEKNCKAVCAQAAADAYQAEAERFVEDIQSCDNQLCRETAVALHIQALDKIHADRAACQETCGHNQGTGAGGQ